MKKKKKLKKVNIMVALFLFIFIICIAALAFIKSDLFDLENINIKGNKLLSEEEIIDISKIKKGRNLFSYNTEEIKNNIESSRYVKKATVEKNFFDTLEIEIVEKNISGIIKERENYYLIDEDLNYVDQIKEETLIDEYKKINIDFHLDDNKIVYEDKIDYNYLKRLVDLLDEYNMDKKVSEISLNRNKKMSLVLQKNIEVVVLEDENLEKNICKLSKILLDLQQRDISSGRLDMSYKNYVLYSY